MSAASPQASSSAALPERSEFCAWLVVLAGVSAALHVGKLAPALPVLRAALDMPLLQAGFLLSTVQLAGMALGLAIGLSVDSLGLRRSVLLGLGLLGSASTAGAFATGPAAMLGLRALEGLGVLLVAMPAPSLIRQLVPLNHLSRLLGLWGAYMPAGTALAMVVGPLWIGLGSPWGGWQGWWLLLAAVSLLMAALVWRQVPSDAARRGQVAAGHAPAVAAWTQRLGRTLGHRGPWLVALCFSVYASQWLAVVGFLPTVYAQAAVDPRWIGVLTGLVAAVNMVGNVVSGRLLQAGWPAARLLRIGYAVMAAGACVCFVDLGAGLPLPAMLRYAGVLLFSGVGGLIPGTLFSLAVRVAPDDQTVSTTVGWMQQLSALGQFGGPPAVAMLAQWVGGWQWTWIFTAACSVFGGLLVWILNRSLESKALPR